MKLTKYSQLRHKKKVTCKIASKKITDAKLSMNKDGRYFICQDAIYGVPAEDMLGYKCSWFLALKGRDAVSWNSSVTDLESVEEEEEEEEGKFYVGQKVWYDGDDWIPEGEYTIAELNDFGDPRIKKESDVDYNGHTHSLFRSLCHPIEDKPKKETKKKPEQWTPDDTIYRRGSDWMKRESMSLGGKEYTIDEAKSEAARLRNALRVHSRLFR